MSSTTAKAGPIVFTLALLVSFAFVSRIVPATVVLFGVGGLIGAAAIGFWSSYLAAGAGAFVGDWLAYELARRYGGKIATMWPLSRDPTLLSRGFALSERWGVPFVFIGRFFGLLRASRRWSAEEKARIVQETLGHYQCDRDNCEQP